tara:strand:- start:95 stop:292 length:198 start_codon:yes stop_codon:yes gene_type:complete
MFASIAKKMGRGHGHVEHQVGEVAAPLKAAYMEGLDEVRNEYVEKKALEAKREELVKRILKEMAA